MSGRIVATYPYTDAAGRLLFEVVRLRDPKDFRQRRPDPDRPGRWADNMHGVTRCLYRLQHVLGAVKRGLWIYVCEGEKDCDRLAAEGLVATTAPGGAAAPWTDAYTASIAGAYVVILPDADDVGRKHAAKVARALHGVAAEVRILALDGLPEKGDVSDWLEGGGTHYLDAARTHEELFELSCAAPVYVPPPAAPSPHPARPARCSPRRHPARQRGRTRTGRSACVDLDAARRVPILTVASMLGLGDGRRTGAEVYVRCPLHDDGRPSLRLHPGKGTWYCDPCGRGGDGLELVMLARGSELPEAARWLLGLPEPERRRTA